VSYFRQLASSAAMHGPRAGAVHGDQVGADNPLARSTGRQTTCKSGDSEESVRAKRDAAAPSGALRRAA